jgi:hyaluronoglucosaminidase
MSVELGIIEGYYGQPWSWAMRQDQVRFLAGHGYGFYIYAPKADPFLRRRWRDDYPTETAEHLRALARCCAENGVRFGVGLSPFEIYRDFDATARDALARKLAFLDAVGVDYLGVLFDDMRGDLPDLADNQARIIHWIAERTKARRIIVCPTYYSDDIGLDTAFGRRPEGYVERFGAALDPTIDIFWTGEEVCSREFSPGHLARVTEQLRRKPFLWDNYPVNDGPRMSPFLYLRAFTGRPASIGQHLSAHAINPALQPVLSRIPALSLAESYRLGEAYQYGQAFRNAANVVLGPDLAKHVERHLSLFQDLGLDRLEDAAERLRQRYAAIDHPGAHEIIAWLDGAYRITREMLEAQ